MDEQKEQGELFDIGEKFKPLELRLQNVENGLVRAIASASVLRQRYELTRKGVEEMLEEGDVIADPCEVVRSNGIECGGTVVHVHYSKRHAWCRRCGSSRKVVSLA